MSRSPTWVAVGLAVLSVSGTAASGGQVGPARAVDELRSQAREVYTFAVTFRAGATTDVALLERPGAVAVGVIGGLVLPLAVSEAFELAERSDVDWVWYLHPDEATLTMRTLQALETAAGTMAKPNLVNLSLGPPTSFYRTEADPDGLVQRALTAVATSGLIVVVAVGNEGRRAPRYVNPWSTPEAVVAVGAWDHETRTVWVHSSSGTPDRPETWPDVVAAGVDRIGPFPTVLSKTPEIKAHDEGNERL